MIKVVIPAAHSGIIAAIVLGMMRAIGETMVVWMASGNATQIPHPWWDVSQSIRTMTATIAGEMGETAEGFRAPPRPVRYRCAAADSDLRPEHRQRVFPLAGQESGGKSVT